MKRWAWVVAGLYGLILIVLIFPAGMLAFAPRLSLGLVLPLILWPYCLSWLVVMVIGQLALLAVPVRVASRRPVTRCSIWLTVLAAALMMGGLMLGASFSILEFIFPDETLAVEFGYRKDTVPSWFVFNATAGTGILTWAIWSVVFYRLSRHGEPTDFVSRFCQCLFRGSILELLIAVPTHIVARYRDYCCAGFETFIGLTMGASVMLFSFGPAVYFLFVARWKRLHPTPKIDIPEMGQGSSIELGSDPFSPPVVQAPVALATDDQLKTRCPHCQAAVRVSESLVGKLARCPLCSKTFKVSSVELALSAFDSLENTPRADESLSITNPDTAAKPDSVEVADPNDAKQAIGRLGRFTLKELLGQGTYGRVYRAYDPLLDRSVALKIANLIPNDKRKVQRFLSEAKSAARLRHPNIVPTYESGQTDGHYYIAAQFVAGETLSNRIKHAPPDYREAAEWVRQLAAALAYAHGEGIVHRDIKPDNIMLDDHRVPQILDFGLAKRLNADATMTIDGTVLGTPAYMAPEQARGDLANVGPLSDEYSLGVVLYELLTGKKPFDGSPHAVIAHVINSEPRPPRSFRADVPHDLEAICQVAMNKDPQQRYQNCSQLADDLARWLGGFETQARPQVFLERAALWCWRKPLLVALICQTTCLLALVSIGGPVWVVRELRYQQIVEQLTKESDEPNVPERPPSLGQIAESPPNPSPRDAELERIKQKSAELGAPQPKPLPTGYGEKPNAPERSLSASQIVESPPKPTSAKSWSAESWKNSPLIKTVSAEHRSGQWATEIMCAVENPDDSRIVQKVAVTPNRTYLLSGWVKTKDLTTSEGWIGANLSIMGGLEGSKALLGTNDWTYLAFVINAKERTELTVGARLGFYGSVVSGVAWFDDLALIEIEQTGSIDHAADEFRRPDYLTAERKAKNLLKNGDFEE